MTENLTHSARAQKIPDEIDYAVGHFPCVHLKTSKVVAVLPPPSPRLAPVTNTIEFSTFISISLVSMV